MGIFFSRQSKPTDAASYLMETDWCKINWGQRNEMKEKLRELRLKNPAVDHLRILVVGPVGAGKSSFIQSVNSIFKNRKINAACKVAAASGKSFTKQLTTNRFKDEQGRDLPFVISDIMGLESGRDSGVHTEDIANAMKGHIKDDYTFNPIKPCSNEENARFWNTDPTLNDKVHCLVFVMSADTFIQFPNDRTTAGQNINCLLDETLIQKVEDIRQKACDLDIPHLVILTKVDQACPHVQKDIKLIYKSKSIHRKAQACSNVSGIPMTDIFPVKNYHEEKQLNTDIDEVLLFTLTEILNYANDYVEEA